jgi:hypothetical protein
MGFSLKGVQKAVYVDGHELKDVIEYRNAVFLPRWEKYCLRLVNFEEDCT